MALWLPLAISFELMMLEGPAFHAAIGRLPNAPLHLAAWGLAMAISLLIESPVIMLLGTSIALVEGPASYAALRRFVTWLCVGCTFVTGLVAFTPLYDFAARTAMGQPAPIADAARPAIQIMLLWTAAIGWRRFLQGVLVRHGFTRLVTVGTAVRLVFAVGAAVALVAWGRLPGVQVAAVAIMAAVVSEALASSLFAQPVLRSDVASAAEPGEPLTQRAILRFHAPLAATTLLTLLAQPLTSAALARLPNPTDTLAAWPVAFMVLMVIRGGAFAYQEIVVAQARRPEALPALRTVAWAMGLAGTALTAAVAFTPLLDLYLVRVLKLPARLHDLVFTAMAAGLFVCLVTALGSWVRGLLVAAGRTKAVYHGMVVNLATHVSLLAIGVALRAPAMVLAAVAFTLAMTAETVYLLRRAGAEHGSGQTRVSLLGAAADIPGGSEEFLHLKHAEKAREDGRCEPRQ